jgi:hypothetical protein
VGDNFQLENICNRVSDDISAWSFLLFSAISCWLMLIVVLLVPHNCQNKYMCFLRYVYTHTRFSHHCTWFRPICFARFSTDHSDGHAFKMGRRNRTIKSIVLPISLFLNNFICRLQCISIWDGVKFAIWLRGK